jgi:hypothetical protein
MFAIIVAAFLLTPKPELAHDRVVQSIFAALWKEGHYGFGHAEAAAFIVRCRGGGIGFVAWHASDEPDSARWEGAIPSGTVAIVHTHPNYLPLPSSIDAATARRTHVPVYVVTSAVVTRTDGISISRLPFDGPLR